MVTLRQYFDTDFQVLSAQQEWPLTSGGQRVQVIARAHYDFNAGAKFVSFYLPAVDNTFKVCSLMLSKVPVLFANIEGSLEVQMGWIGSDELEQAKDLAFSGRVFIYSEVDLKGSDLSNLEALATASAMSVRLRGKAMLLARASDNRPQAFISHDFGDKEVVARPLTIALSKLRCPVWYDEFSLKIGRVCERVLKRG